MESINRNLGVKVPGQLVYTYWLNNLVGPMPIESIAEQLVLQMWKLDSRMAKQTRVKITVL